MLERCAWLMTEKIPGANRCLMTRGDGVFAAKRKALLQPHEPFFNAQEIVARTQRPLVALCEALQAQDRRRGVSAACRATRCHWWSGSWG